MSTELSRSLLASLKPCLKFQHSPAGNPGTSLDFDSGSGELALVGCSGDDSINLYSCTEGEHRKTLFSKKYGLGTARFTHKPTCLLHTSTRGGNDAIRYLSWHDYQYLGYFEGHRKPVTQLEVSPRNDTFISAADGDALCLWDLRVKGVQGKLDLLESGGRANGSMGSSEPLVAYDPEGVVFALATDNRYLRLFDARNWERGHFVAFELCFPESRTAPASKAASRWSGLKFSPDGSEILITLNHSSTCGLLIDAFKGDVVASLKMPEQMPLYAHYTTDALSFTPDGKFILGGRSDGQLTFWPGKDLESNGQISSVIESLPSGSYDAIRCAAWNPKLAMLVTVSSSTFFHSPIEQ